MEATAQRPARGGHAPCRDFRRWCWRWRGNAAFWMEERRCATAWPLRFAAWADRPGRLAGAAGARRPRPAAQAQFTVSHTHRAAHGTLIERVLLTAPPPLPAGAHVGAAHPVSTHFPLWPSPESAADRGLGTAHHLLDLSLAATRACSRAGRGPCGSLSRPPWRQQQGDSQLRLELPPHAPLHLAGQRARQCPLWGPLPGVACRGHDERPIGDQTAQPAGWLRFAGL